MGDKAKMPYRFYFYLVVRVRSDSSVGSHKLKFYWPASVNRMGCTRETRVISTDDHFKPIEQSFLWLSLIHISEPTRRTPISYAVFCLKKKKKKNKKNKKKKKKKRKKKRKNKKKKQK